MPEDHAAPADQVIRAIGRLVVEFNGLQLFLEVLAWELADVGKSAGVTITGELPFSALTRVVCNLGEQARPDLNIRERFEKRLQLAEERRNALVHSRWVLPSRSWLIKIVMGAADDKAVRRKFSRRRGRVESEELHVQEVERVLDELHELVTDLGSLLVELGGESGLRVVLRMLFERFDEPVRRSVEHPAPES